MKIASLFMLVLTFAAEAEPVDVVDLVVKELKGKTGSRGVHGDSISVSFTSEGVFFQHELFIDHSIFAEGNVAKFYAGDELVREEPFRSLSYNTKTGVEPRVAAVVKAFDDIEAVIIDNKRDEVFTLRTVTLEDGSSKHTLTKASETDEEHPYHKEITALIKSATQQSESRRLVAGDPNDPSHQGLDEWTNCFPGQGVVSKILTVGMAADVGYFKAYGSNVANVQASFTKLFTFSNLIYGQQMNIYLRLDEATIQERSGGPNWNQDRTSCTSIDRALDQFMEWRILNDKQNVGIHHLMTACYPAPGIVGLAAVGTLCDRAANVGITSVLIANKPDQDTWKTFAHEVGHNFGALHSFEEGQGRTGGLMDYGDGRTKNGKYQFNTKYRKPMICNHLRTAMNLGRSGTDSCFINGIPGTGTGTGGKGTQGKNPTYAWKASAVEQSECSTVCGGGIKYVKVECIQTIDRIETLANEALCNADTRETAETTPIVCNTQACTDVVCSTCTDYNCCSEGCTIKCATTANRDAGFKIARGIHTYMLRGDNVARYTTEKKKKKKHKRRRRNRKDG